MTLAEIRLKLCELLNTITELGKVWHYRRWTIHLDEIIELYRAGDVINAWEISVSGDSEVDISYPKTGVVTYEFRLFGYYSLVDKDATEIEFEKIVEKIKDTIRANRTLGGKAWTVEPATREVFEPRIFVDILVHYCEILIPVKVYKLVS